MSRLLLRIASRWLILLCVAIALGALLGRLMPRSIAAIDPLGGMARDLALRDMNHFLDVPIAQTDADERAATWSPDGGHLAYLSIQGGVQTLWVMDADGWNRRTLNVAVVGHPETAAVAWSPRGDTIAFTALAGDRQVIFVTDVTTGAQRQLTATGSSASSPAWSPDGTSIAFAWSLVANQEIFIANVDAVVEPLARSTEVLRVTSDYGMDAMPAWSPDGETIAFFSTRDGNSNIYVYTVATGDLRRITYNSARNTAPAWTPDGSALLFRSFQDNAWSVYRVETDCLMGGGCTARQILQGDYTVTWRP